MTPRDQIYFDTARVLDGGMASELEFLGADISGPLWSADVLEESTKNVIAVHRAYVTAGADVLLTASYQVSRRGYAEFGLDATPADRALLRAVELAAAARAEFPARNILIAAALGPMEQPCTTELSTTATTSAPTLRSLRFISNASRS